MISNSGYFGKKFFISVAAVLILVFSLQLPVAAQESLAVQKKDTAYSFWSRHNLAKVSVIGLGSGMLLYGYAVWWKHNYRSFRWYKEGRGIFDAHLGIDKVGHAYTSYFLFHTMNDIFKWGDYPKDEAFWWSAGIAAFHALAIETGDGLSDWGFDPKDLASNWTGVAYGMLQEKVPFFKNFQFKWSLYYPLNRHAFKVNDLYDYHIYLMSAKVHNLLPDSWKPYWPKFLQLGVGYSGANNVTRREYILTFDYDLELIPTHNKDLTLLKSIINMFHLPAPGVKFSAGHKPVFSLLLLN